MKLIGLLGNDRMLKIAGFEKNAGYVTALPGVASRIQTLSPRGGAPATRLPGPVSIGEDVTGPSRIRPSPVKPEVPVATATPAPATPAPEAPSKPGVVRRSVDATERVVGGAAAAPFNVAGWIGERIPGFRHVMPGFRAIRDPATAGHLAEGRATRMGGAAGILPHIVGLSPWHTAALGAGLGALFADKDEGAVAGALRGATIGGLGGYGLTRWRDSALRNEAGFYGGPQAVRKALAAGQVPQATRPLPPPRVQPEPENVLE